MAATQGIVTDGVPYETARPPAGREAASRWRYELERAQGPARARSVAGAEAKPANGGEVTRARGAGEDDALASRPGRDIASRGESGAPTATVAATEPEAQAAAPRSRTQEDARPALPASAPAEPKNALVTPPASRRAVPRAQRVAWPRVHMHALHDADAIRIWVRDASLRAAAARRLLGELERRLRASGRHLAELTVNGERIHLLERSLSWRSKR